MIVSQETTALTMPLFDVDAMSGAHKKPKKSQVRLHVPPLR
jgi:hypothetical protein